MSNKDFRTLEQKIRGIMVEKIDPRRNTREREKVTNVGRPETALDNFEPRSRLAKQGEIKTKIIDEADEARKMDGGKTQVDLDPKTDDRMDVESADVRKKPAFKKVIKEASPLEGEIIPPKPKTKEAVPYKPSFERTPMPSTGKGLIGRAISGFGSIAKGAIGRVGGGIAGAVLDSDELNAGEKEILDKRIRDIAKEKGIKPGDLPPVTAPKPAAPTSNGRELGGVPKPAPAPTPTARTKDDNLPNISSPMGGGAAGAEYPGKETETMSGKNSFTLTKPIPKPDASAAIKKSIEADNPGTPAPPEKATPKAAPKPSPKPAPKLAAPKAAEPEKETERVVPRGGSKGDFDKPDDRYVGSFDKLTQASPEERAKMVKKSRQEAGLEEGNLNMFSKEELERLAQIEANMVNEFAGPVVSVVKAGARKVLRGTGTAANLGLGGYTAYEIGKEVLKDKEQPEPETQKEPEQSSSDAETETPAQKKQAPKTDLDMPVLDKYEKKPAPAYAPKNEKPAQKSGSLDSMSFGDAFKASRAKAKESGDASTGQFTWRGKQYQTNVKGEKYVPMSKQRKVSEELFSDEEIARLETIDEAIKLKTKPKVKNPEIDIEPPSSNLPVPVPKGKPPAPKSKKPVEPDDEIETGKDIVPYEAPKTKTPSGKKMPRVPFPIPSTTDIEPYDDDEEPKGKEHDNEPDDESETKSVTTQGSIDPWDDEKTDMKFDSWGKEEPKNADIPKVQPWTTPKVDVQPMPKSNIDNPQTPPPPKVTPPKAAPKPTPMPKATPKATKEPESKGGTWYYQDPNSDIVRTWGNTKDGEAPWKPQGGANREKFTSPGGQLNVGPDTPNRGIRGSTFGKDSGPSVKDTSWKPEVSAHSTEKSKKKTMKESFSKETPMFQSDNKFGSSDSLIAAAKAVMEAKYKNEKELAAMGHPKDKITKKDVLIARGVIAKEDVASPAATKPPAERSQQAKPANVPLPPRRPAELKQKGDDEDRAPTGMRTFEDADIAGGGMPGGKRAPETNTSSENVPGEPKPLRWHRYSSNSKSPTGSN